MNIIERTQYSADGGKTWAVDEDNARIYAVHGNLAAHVGDMRAGYILDSIREHPDALITALRDMGALPEESGESNDWANGSWARAAEAVEHGELHHAGQRYAVIPVEQHENGRKAIEQVKALSLNPAWCRERGIDWEGR